MSLLYKLQSILTPINNFMSSSTKTSLNVFKLFPYATTRPWPIYWWVKFCFQHIKIFSQSLITPHKLKLCIGHKTTHSSCSISAILKKIIWIGQRGISRWPIVFLFSIRLHILCVTTIETLIIISVCISLTNFLSLLKQILTANINTYSEVERELQPIIIAQKVRIFPYSQYDRTVCLRTELIGCPFDGEWMSDWCSEWIKKMGKSWCV